MVLDGRLFHVIWSIKVRARHELSAGKMRFAWAIPNTNVFIAQAANTILSRGRPFGRFILRSRNHSGRERELHSYVDIHDIRSVRLAVGVCGVRTVCLALCSLTHAMHTGMNWLELGRPIYTNMGKIEFREWCKNKRRKIDQLR